MPRDQAAHVAIVLDPMLATGWNWLSFDTAFLLFCFEFQTILNTYNGGDGSYFLRLYSVFSSSLVVCFIIDSYLAPDPCFSFGGGGDSCFRREAIIIPE